MPASSSSTFTHQSTRDSLLVYLEQAKALLAAVRRVDEVREIRDQAEAMRAYARLAQLGLEAQNHAAEIKLYAERRVGELLAATISRGGDSKSHAVTLADAGIGRMQSSRWQAVARVPRETFEQHIAATKAAGRELTSAAVQQLARAHQRAQTNAALVAAYAAAPESPAAGILEGNSAALLPTLPAASVDAIITDPPYESAAVPLYGHLARAAARLLKPGGICVVLTGHVHLPQVFGLFSDPQTYGPHAPRR